MIAFEFGISINTVGNIAANAYRKLSVHSAAAAVAAHRDVHAFCGSRVDFGPIRHRLHARPQRDVSRGAMMVRARREAEAMSVYTTGIWPVKPGREDEFVAAWWEFAQWSSQEFSVATGSEPLLPRDREQPGRFVSYGPWDSVDQIAVWRTHPGFRERVTHMTELLENFAPATLDPVPWPA